MLSSFKDSHFHDPVIAKAGKTFSNMTGSLRKTIKPHPGVKYRTSTQLFLLSGV